MCLSIDRAKHPGPVVANNPVEHLSVEFVSVGGWLTNGDLALDSRAQFLAVAEHSSIPERNIGHQLREAGLQSVWAPRVAMLGWASSALERSFPCRC